MTHGAPHDVAVARPPAGRAWGAGKRRLPDRARAAARWLAPNRLWIGLLAREHPCMRQGFIGLACA